MNFFSSIQHNVYAPLGRVGDWFLPTLARFIFAATLFVYFYGSAMLKIGEPELSTLFTADGINSLVKPTMGMFVQMLPEAADASGYDVDAATTMQKVIMISGTWAEFLLPVLIIVGLFTRVAAIGMVVFIGVMTYVDLYGHGGISDLKILGAWFDSDTASIVADQRLYWIFLLLYLFFRGAGPLSIDRLFKGKRVHRYDE